MWEKDCFENTDWVFGCGNLQGPESAEMALETESNRINERPLLAWHWSLSGTKYTVNNFSNICICIHDTGFSRCPIKLLSMGEMFASSEASVSALASVMEAISAKAAVGSSSLNLILSLFRQRKLLKAVETVSSCGS